MQGVAELVCCEGWNESETPLIDTPEGLWLEEWPAQLLLACVLDYLEFLDYFECFDYLDCLEHFERCEASLAFVTFVFENSLYLSVITSSVFLWLKESSVSSTTLEL